DYLPRPGPQFLWLYQTLKHVPGAVGSVIGVVLPGIGLSILLLLPWLDRSPFRTVPQRAIGGVILGVCVLLIVTMTFAAKLSDRRDPRTREQLARQAAQETTQRSEPFNPTSIKPQTANAPAAQDTNGPPAPYITYCANCHGPHGEGARQGRLSFPPLIGVAAKPQRTVSDIVGLLKNPAAYDLQPPMRSFADTLNEQQMKDIADWIVRLPNRP